MQHKFCFEAVHRTFQDICDDNDHLFGGIPMLFGGDFAQILPVVPKGNRAQTVNASLQASKLIWPRIKILFLRENMRVRGADEINRAFVKWIGDLPYNPTLHSPVSFPTGVTTRHDIKDLYESVFPAALLSSCPENPDLFRTRAILCPRNASVTEI